MTLKQIPRICSQFLSMAASILKYLASFLVIKWQQCRRFFKDGNFSGVYNLGLRLSSGCLKALLRHSQGPLKALLRPSGGGSRHGGPVAAASAPGPRLHLYKSTSSTSHMNRRLPGPVLEPREDI